jgi:hypothetical protein
MEHRRRKAIRHHCQSPVEAPERGAKRIRYSRKATTRRRVRLEHYEWLPILTSKGSRIDVGGHKACGYAVCQIGGEDILRILYGSPI